MKKRIIIFGYGITGVKLYRDLLGREMEVLGFADNARHKQGNYVDDRQIYSLEDIIQLKKQEDFAVIIASKRWFEIGRELEKNNIPIEGIYINGDIQPYEAASFDKLDLNEKVKLYAGDICDEVHMNEKNLYGLSINKADAKHIFHDITERYPLPDESIFAYQAEDVFEHIEFEKMLFVLNEIYRILKKGSVLRICLPDYNSPWLNKISMKDDRGRILYDPTGGGNFGAEGVKKGGHVWFPTCENVRDLLEKSRFKKFEFLCYHTVEQKLIKKNINYINGYINRVSAVEDSWEIYSMVIDCEK